MIHLITAIPLIDFVLLSLLGTFVFFLNRKNALNRIYAATCLIGAIIGIAEYGITTANSHGAIIFWIFVFSIWPFQLSAILYLVLHITGRAENIEKLKLVYKLILFSACITSFVYFSSRFTMIHWVRAGWGWVEASHGLPVQDIFVIVWSTFICVLVLFLGFTAFLKIGDKKKKAQIAIVVIACSIQLVLNIMAKGILPYLLKTPFPDNVSFGLTIQAIIIGYAIWKYDLFLLNPATAAETILSVMDSALLLCDPWFHIVRVNVAALRMFRFSESEFGRLAITALIDNFDLIQLEYFSEKRTYKGAGAVTAAVATANGGMKIDISVTASELRDNRKEIAGYIFIINDITTIKETESALLKYQQKLEQKNKEILDQTALFIESEARFKAIYEGSNDAIMLLTEKGFFDCNPRTLEMFGFKTVEEFSKVHPADISPPNQPDGTESFPAAMERIKTAFEQGSNRFEWVHRRADGEDFPAEVLLSAFTLNGKIVLQATVRDISKRKQAELALQESEKKYRALVETTGTGFLILDSQGRVLDANREYVRLSGHGELREIIGRSVVEWTAEVSRQKNAKAVAQCVREGFIRNLVIEYADKRGGTIPVEINATVNGEGEKMRIISLCRDITERKKIEAALVESEKSFRSMFEMTSEGVGLINTSTNRFIAANPALCVMFGYTEEEFCTLTPDDLTPPESKEIMQKSIETFFKIGYVPDHEETSMKKDGTRVHSIIGSRQLTWKGEIVSFITYKNITSLKEAQEKLKKKNAEVLEFTNTVTHDLKKPLTVMKTICSLAKMNAIASRDTEFVEATQIGAESILYMQEMLDDLLVSAKLESGNADLALEEFSYKQAVEQAIQRLKLSIEEKRIRIDIGENDMLITADFKQIGRLLMNLIGNAINYIGDKPDKHISIRWEQKDGSAEFTVEDNGIGIPQETQGHLFTKFKRGTNISGISGTGLGLSIVKGIVLAHGGKIWFESKEGEGTAFHFTLG